MINLLSVILLDCGNLKWLSSLYLMWNSGLLINRYLLVKACGDWGLTLWSLVILVRYIIMDEPVHGHNIPTYHVHFFLKDIKEDISATRYKIVLFFLLGQSTDTIFVTEIWCLALIYITSIGEIICCVIWYLVWTLVCCLLFFFCFNVTVSSLVIRSQYCKPVYTPTSNRDWEK